MKLTITPFSSDRFTFKNNAFIAEASDFNGQEINRQLYDDACDVGLAIQSSKTKVIIHYVQLKAIREHGEVVAWEYFPVSEDVRKHPGAAETKVVILND